MVPSIAMPLIASGADTGIVVDIGYDETTIAAFVHGKFLVGTVKCKCMSHVDCSATQFQNSIAS